MIKNYDSGFDNDDNGGNCDNTNGDSGAFNQITIMVILNTTSMHRKRI